MSVDEPYEKLRVALGLQTRHLDSVIHALRDRDEEPLRVTLLHDPGLRSNRELGPTAHCYARHGNPRLLWNGSIWVRTRNEHLLH